MKREYFGMLFMSIVLAIILIAYYFFEEKIVMDNISRYIIIWILVGFSVGQYSMKFPKAF